MSVDARGVCARSGRETGVLSDMDGRKWAVDNVELVANWDRVVNEVIFAIVRYVYAKAENVQLTVIAQNIKMAHPAMRSEDRLGSRRT